MPEAEHHLGASRSPATPMTVQSIVRYRLTFTPLLPRAHIGDLHAWPPPPRCSAEASANPPRAPHRPFARRVVGKGVVLRAGAQGVRDGLSVARLPAASRRFRER